MSKMKSDCTSVCDSHKNRLIIFLQICAFACVLFGIKLWLIRSYGNATPYWDQWDAEAENLYKPFLNGTLDWRSLFSPHNEHRILTSRLISLALLMINGIWNPLLQMVVNAILHISTIILSIILLARILGKKHLTALLFFSIVLFGVPYGWENTLVGFQSQFYFVLIFSIASLSLSVTPLPLSFNWWCGIVCGVLAFFSMASGIFAFAAAAFVSFALYAFKLRKTKNQLIAVVILTGLFMLGVMLTPSLVGHASLKATSFPQFLDALMAILGWPISSNLFTALVRNLPALVFVGVMLWKRPPANDRKWFLFALILLVLGQAASIAYGRASGNLSSRYLDLYAIGILVNFACLIYFVQGYIVNQHGWTIIGVGFWIIIVFISLGLYTCKRIPTDLATKRDTGHIQEINTKNYLAMGNIKYLKDKPHLDIPYPDPDRLAFILSSVKIRNILPTNIRYPIKYLLIESIPANAFVVDGYSPSTPKVSGLTLGSYGLSSGGSAVTGQATIKFDTQGYSGLVALPISGHPLNDGIMLEIEKNEKRSPITVWENPGDSWQIAYVMIENGKLNIHLTDSSTTSWLAISNPVALGRLDKFTNTLLNNYYFSIAIGMAIFIYLIFIRLLVGWKKKYGNIQN